MYKSTACVKCQARAGQSKILALSNKLGLQIFNYIPQVPGFKLTSSVGCENANKSERAEGGIKMREWCFLLFVKEARIFGERECCMLYHSSSSS
jgi:hypothetical protein